MSEINRRKQPDKISILGDRRYFLAYGTEGDNVFYLRHVGANDNWADKMFDIKVLDELIEVLVHYKKEIESHG